jgi:peptide/nickel transport system permease protein
MADVLKEIPTLGAPLSDTGTRYVAESRLSAFRARLWRYLRQPEVLYPAIYLLIIVLVCFIGPLVLPLPSPVHNDLSNTLAKPFSKGHLLGTDNLGQDVLSRLIYGGRVSLEVGACAVAIGMFVGTTIGTTAAYKGGWVDAVVMRCLDVLLAFPALILALAIADILGASIRNVIIAISFFTIPAYARLSRGETLRMRDREYVVASRGMGSKTVKILFGHLFPNVVPVVMTVAFLQVGTAMLTEAALSFLGLGVPIPTPSWGNMIQVGQNYLETDPWLVLIPSFFLFTTILALNLIGNGVREVLTSEAS